MIEFDTYYGHIDKLKVHGTTDEIMADISVLIAAVYSQLYRHEPEEAECFKFILASFIAEDSLKGPDAKIFDKGFFDNCVDKDGIIEDKVVKVDVSSLEAVFGGDSDEDADT